MFKIKRYYRYFVYYRATNGNDKNDLIIANTEITMPYKITSIEDIQRIENVISKDEGFDNCVIINYIFLKSGFDNDI